MSTSINDDLMSGGKLQAALFSTDASGNVTGLVGPDGGNIAVRIAPPPPSGVVADDHLALTAFFDAAPNKAIIEFPRGADYTVFGGAIRHRPGQIINYNNCTIKRADEVVTTTTGVVAHGDVLTIPVTSTSGFLPGQAIGIYGTKSGGNTVIAWQCRITAVNANSLTASNTAQFINITAGGYTTSDILTGATVITRGTLIDSASLMSATSREIIENLYIDGNKANNATNNRWEYSCDIKFRTMSGVLSNTLIENSCGEGVIIWGDNPRIDGLRATGLNGNGIHFNSGCNDALVNNVFIDGCNLVDIGHSDGAIIASDATYRTIIQQWRVKNSLKSAIGSWDQSDNAYAKILNGYAEDCRDGLRLISLAPSSDVELSDITIKNCGPSYLGALRTSVSQLASANRWSVRNLRLIDSMAFVSGLADSHCEIFANHVDSATNTSTTTASSRSNNYVGYILSELGAIVTFTTCERTKLVAKVTDGAASPLANKACINFMSSGGGPTVDCEVDFSANGNTFGILSDSPVLINCSGRVAVKNWASGSTGWRLQPTSVAVNAAFVSGREKSRSNKFAFHAYYDKAAPGANTFALKANQQSANNGWLEIGGRIEFNTTPTGLCYGAVTQTNTYKVRLNGMECVGPAANWMPYALAAGAVAGDGRVSNCRSYPAAAALPANWTAEDAGIVTLQA